MIITSIPGQSVWNIITPVGICLGQVRGSFFETAGGGGRRLIFRVDELGTGKGISQCTCNRGWSGVHTNRGNKVLLVQTPGIKMAGSFARCVVRQLQVGNIQKPLRSGSLHTTRRTLFTPWAASTVCGASLALFWVYQVTKIKGPKTEFIKITERENMWSFKLGED